MFQRILQGRILKPLLVYFVGQKVKYAQRLLVKLNRRVQTPYFLQTHPHLDLSCLTLPLIFHPFLDFLRKSPQRVQFGIDFDSLENVSDFRTSPLKLSRNF